jgi:NADH:ubiquinone oxidoreductase subunit F (NADH-binding)
VPCRAGSAESHRLAEQDLVGHAPALRALLALMSGASLCGFGRGVPGPIESLLARVAPA